MHDVRMYARLVGGAVRRYRTPLLLIALVVLFLALSAARADAQSRDSAASSNVVVATSGEEEHDRIGRAGSVSYPLRLPAGAVVVRGGEDPEPIVNAIEEYRRTGEARTIQQSAYVAYPYGHSQPTLTCAPLRACVIELEAGEVVLGLVAGDTERWIIGQTFAGRGGDTPLVVVKPTDFDLTTNLLISTDRRIYELTLDAPPARRPSRNSSNPQEVYTRRIRFYYPDDMIRTFEAQQAALVEAEARTGANVIPMGEAFRLENLNFHYDWEASRHFPFRLEQVFDDGAHTYIKLPASAEHEAAPVLFVLDGGERSLLNYAVREAGEGSVYYITDRVFQDGILVLGKQRKNWLGKTRHDEETLTIRNLSRD